jgi:hypothetical protein
VEHWVHLEAGRIHTPRGLPGAPNPGSVVNGTLVGTLAATCKPKKLNLPFGNQEHVKKGREVYSSEWGMLRMIVICGLILGVS